MGIVFLMSMKLNQCCVDNTLSPVDRDMMYRMEFQ